MASPALCPQRGEIWFVYTPAMGDKEHPALVLSDEASGHSGARVVLPFSTEKQYSQPPPARDWILRIEPTEKNGLRTTSLLNLMLVRAFRLSEFRRKLGVIDEIDFDHVATQLHLLLGI